MTNDENSPNLHCVADADNALKLKISMNKPTYSALKESDVSVINEVTSRNLYLVLSEIHHLISKKDIKKIFAHPVTDEIAAGYSEVITQPMDLGTIYNKLRSRAFYHTVADYMSDVKLMCTNAMTYNLPDTIYYQRARKLLVFCRKLLTPIALHKLCKELNLHSALKSDEIGKISSLELQQTYNVRSVPVQRQSKPISFIETDSNSENTPIKSQPSNVSPDSIKSMTVDALEPSVQKLPNTYSTLENCKLSSLSPDSCCFRSSDSSSTVLSKSSCVNNDCAQKPVKKEKVEENVVQSNSNNNSITETESSMTHHTVCSSKISTNFCPLLPNSSSLSPAKIVESIITPLRRGRGRPRKIRPDQTPLSTSPSTHSAVHLRTDKRFDLSGRNPKLLKPMVSGYKESKSTITTPPSSYRAAVNSSLSKLSSTPFTQFPKKRGRKRLHNVEPNMVSTPSSSMKVGKTGATPITNTSSTNNNNNSSLSGGSNRNETSQNLSRLGGDGGIDHFNSDLYNYNSYSKNYDQTSTNYFVNPFKSEYSDAGLYETNRATPTTNTNNNNGGGDEIDDYRLDLIHRGYGNEMSLKLEKCDSYNDDDVAYDGEGNGRYSTSKWPKKDQPCLAYDSGMLIQTESVESRTNASEIIRSSLDAAKRSSLNLKQRYSNTHNCDKAIGPKIVYLDMSEPGKVMAIECPQCQSKMAHESDEDEEDDDDDVDSNEEKDVKDEKLRRPVHYPPDVIQALGSNPMDKLSSDAELIKKENEVLSELHKLKYAVDEPIGSAIHGPLAIFDQYQLHELCELYSTDPALIEYALSLLKFVEPVGPWAKQWAHERLNLATDGLHAQYFTTQALLNPQKTDTDDVKVSTDADSCGQRPKWWITANLTIDPPPPVPLDNPGSSDEDSSVITNSLTEYLQEGLADRLLSDDAPLSYPESIDNASLLQLNKINVPESNSVPDCSIAETSSDSNNNGNNGKICPVTGIHTTLSRASEIEDTKLSKVNPDVDSNITTTTTNNNNNNNNSNNNNNGSSVLKTALSSSVYSLNPQSTASHVVGEKYVSETSSFESSQLSSSHSTITGHALKNNQFNQKCKEEIRKVEQIIHDVDLDKCNVYSDDLSGYATMSIKKDDDRNNNNNNNDDNNINRDSDCKESLEVSNDNHKSLVKLFPVTSNTATTKSSSLITHLDSKENTGASRRQSISNSTFPKADSDNSNISSNLLKQNNDRQVDSSHDEEKQPMEVDNSDLSEPNNSIVQSGDSCPNRSAMNISNQNEVKANLTANNTQIITNDSCSEPDVTIQDILNPLDFLDQDHDGTINTDDSLVSDVSKSLNPNESIKCDEAEDGNHAIDVNNLNTIHHSNSDKTTDLNNCHISDVNSNATDCSFQVNSDSIQCSNVQQIETTSDLLPIDSADHFADKQWENTDGLNIIPCDMNVNTNQLSANVDYSEQHEDVAKSVISDENLNSIIPTSTNIDVSDQKHDEQDDSTL